jgi:type IV pilus assembly protein PilW
MKSLHAPLVPSPRRRNCPQATRERGFTLVELLVAMAISSVIAIAAVSALIVSRQGFVTVDAASQLRDNARFTIDLIQRLGVQAGYEDFIYATTNRLVNVAGIASNPDASVAGFNNAIPSATDPFNAATTRTAGLGYGSDVLILRYQASETFPGSGISDRTMINCAGNPSTAIPINRDDRMTSVLYVDISQGEPSLMCSTGPSTGQPIIQGVENFQVLYGVDNVIPNTAPVAGATTDSVADRFLRADQMVVPSDPVGTNANWRRVRSLRIGMVIRGPIGSAQDSTAQTLYPLGQAKGSSGGSAGSAMSSTTDAGTIFSPGADSRMRQVVTFTVHLRNEQGL